MQQAVEVVAGVLDADEQELLILADKVPKQIRKRLKERSDAIRQLADLDDETLDGLLANIDSTNPRKKPRLK